MRKLTHPKWNCHNRTNSTENLKWDVMNFLFERSDSCTTTFHHQWVIDDLSDKKSFCNFLLEHSPWMRSLPSLRWIRRTWSTHSRSLCSSSSHHDRHLQFDDSLRLLTIYWFRCWRLHQEHYLIWTRVWHRQDYLAETDKERPLILSFHHWSVVVSQNLLWVCQISGN